MTSSLEKYLLALSVLCLVIFSNAQMCPGDHDRLKHHSEFNITVTCYPQDPDTYLAFHFHNNSGIFKDIDAGGWCIDVDRLIYCDHGFMVDSYSSYDLKSIPESAIEHPQNLDAANWLINSHPIESEIDIPRCHKGVLGYEEYQEAMWTLMDGPGRKDDLGAKDCVVDWLVKEAETKGQNFRISCGTTKKIGVVLVIDDDTGYIKNQVVMAEINIADLDGICDCGVKKGGGGPVIRGGSPGVLNTGSVMGDPHFQTWSGELYDFHGICDLIFVKNPDFMYGLGLDIHVRSRKVKQFSYISTAAIRIGNDTLEVAGRHDGETYWLNGKKGPSDGGLDGVAFLSGYPLIFRELHSHGREYTIYISDEEKIVFVTWKDFVRIDIHGATPDNFHGSLGLIGSFDQNGLKLGRDEVTVFDDVNKFGIEWQVLPSEAKLFHKDDGPQSPAMCELPRQAALRRRLAESTMTQEEAESACSHVGKKADRDSCVFDVMATNDKDVAGAY